MLELVFYRMECLKQFKNFIGFSDIHIIAGCVFLPQELAKMLR
jgi:hypothetical protein